jgi:hypothetical protein
MRPVEIIPGMGEEGTKVEWCRGWIQLWYIVRIFVTVTKHSQYNKTEKCVQENS